MLKATGLKVTGIVVENGCWFGSIPQAMDPEVPEERHAKPTANQHGDSPLPPEAVTQLLNHLPDCAVVFSSDLKRIRYANAAAVRHLLPALTGPGCGGGAEMLHLHPRIQGFATRCPENLPLRICIRVSGQRTVAELHVLHGPYGRDVGRLLRWPSW